MKNLVIVIVLGFMFLTAVNIKPEDKGKKDNKMKRFLVERTFTEGLVIPVNDEGSEICLNVVTTNAEDQVTWVHSYVSKDRKKSYCIYDAPSAEHIKTAAKKNNLPVDAITEVRVLDPYFYK